MGEEVVIGLEHGQVDDLEPSERSADANEVVRQPFDDAATRRLEKAVLLCDFGKHGFQAHEGTALEVDQVLPIGCAALRKYHDWVELVGLLTLSDSLADLILN